MINCNENENHNERSLELWTQIYKVYYASVRSCLYVISNTWATFKAQFIKKLSITEAELKKSVAYKKSLYMFASP